MIETLAAVMEAKEMGALANEGIVPDFGKELKPQEIKEYLQADKPLHAKETIKEEIVDLQKLSKEYTDALKELSPYPETIAEQDISKWEKVSSEEVAEQRVEFRNVKNTLIEQWGIQMEREWPRYDQDIYSENGIKIRSAGDYYDAHHIRPLEYGGQNTVDNITPLHAKDHYDRQGIHSPVGIYQQIGDALK